MITGWRSIGLAVVLFCLGTGAQSAIVVNVTENGGNVVYQGSGTLDLTGLTGPVPSIPDPTPGADPAFGSFIVGMAATSLDVYTAGFSILPSFGTGGGNVASSGSGDLFGFIGPGLPPDTGIYLPSGYASGASLSGIATFAGETFASLGLTPGSYSANLNNGDSMTLNVVPLPAAVWLMASGLLGLGALARVRRNRTVGLGASSANGS